MAIDFNIHQSNGTHKLQDLDKLLSTDDVHTSWDRFKFDSSVHQKALDAHAKAKTYGEVRGDNFITGSASSKVGLTTAKFEELAKRKKDLEDSISERKAFDPKADVSGLQKSVTKIDSEISKHNDLMSREMSRSKERFLASKDALLTNHDKVMDEITKKRYKIEDDLVKQRDAATITQAEYESKVGNLQKNYEELTGQLKNRHEKLIELHNEHIEGIDSAAVEAERHSKLKMNLGKATSTTEKAAQGMGRDDVIGKLWSNHQTGGKIITGLGGLAVLHGTYKMLNPEVNPETGKTEISGTNVAETGGGLLTLIVQALRNPGVEKAVSNIRV